MGKARPERILEDIQALAAISSTPAEDGITRVSWTEEYARGTDYVKRRMQEAGLEVTEDEAGNLCGCRRGSSPVGSILSGSHLDTVFCSGAYDGIQGVACALEAARLLEENGIRLRNHYKVLGMAEEEGTRTGCVLTGSTCIRRELEGKGLPDITGRDGRPLREILEEYRGFQQVQVPRASLLQREPMAYVEIHDEQGPVLEQAGEEIGIVEHIRGIRNFDVILTGASGHPGTVPMTARRDCSLAAYAVCLAASRYVEEHFDKEATITFGKMLVRPGSSNSIPGEAEFSVDIRFGSREAGEDIVQKVRALVQEQAQEAGLQVQLREHMSKDVVPMAGRLQEIIQEVCWRQGLSARRMDSGAGHDAMNFAAVCPSAMIFTPCRDGVSHNVKEYVPEASLGMAADVLYETILELDKEIGK